MSRVFTRTIQVIEATTDMGDVEVDDELNQSVDGPNPARFSVTTKSTGDVKFIPLGKAVESF